MLRRLAAASALAGVLLLPAAVVSAHECYIANRSDTGDAAAAAHSSQWEVLTLHDVFAFILPDVLGQPPLTEAQLEWAITTAEADPYNVPSSWVTRSDKTIGEGSANPNLANGRGLDHLSDVYGPTLGAIYFQAEGQ